MGFCLPKNNVVTGRGSTAIYLLLAHLSKEAGRAMELMAPVDVCYAALYPALYAGWSIRFIDVSPLDGNIEVDTVRKAFAEKRPDALLAPHMYGQPIADLPEIAELCRRSGVVLVEDCACAMGATAEYPLGYVGDYSIFSTGYAKVVDLGFGGLLASGDDELAWASRDAEALPFRSASTEQTETLFGKVYRALRSFPDDNLDQEIYKVMPEAARGAFLYRLEDVDERRVREALSSVDGVVADKRSIFQSCKQLWDKSEVGDVRVFPYVEGAVPWRFSFFVEAPMRKAVIDACLNAGIPISDWYPSVAPMFGDTGDYPGAQQIGETILNVPLNEASLAKTVPDVIAILAQARRDVRL